MLGDINGSMRPRPTRPRHSIRQKARELPAASRVRARVVVVVVGFMMIFLMCYQRRDCLVRKMSEWSERQHEAADGGGETWEK